MTDIVERLRQDLKLQHEAADEIERLRAALKMAERELRVIGRTPETLAHIETVLRKGDQ